MQNLVLVIADEAAVRSSIGSILEGAGFRAVTARDGRALPNF